MILLKELNLMQKGEQLNTRPADEPEVDEKCFKCPFIEKIKFFNH